MSFIQNNIAVIISVIGIIVTILLVREARHKILEGWRKFKQHCQHFWSLKKVRFAFIFLGTIFLLAVLVRFGVLSIGLFWSSLIILAGLIIGVNLSINTHIQEFKQATEQMRILQQQGNAFAYAMTIRTELVKNKWPEVLDKLSVNISLTAIEGLIKSAEIYDFTGDVIILRISPMLEPTYNALESRISEIEPILEEVYGKCVRLHIFTDHYSKPLR